MSAGAWFAGFLILVWLFGYAIGHIFLNLRRFVDKVK